MKILHVGPSLIELPAQKGGAVERRMVSLASAQAVALGVPVEVFGARSTGAEQETLGNLVYIRCGGGRSLFGRMRFLLGLAQCVWRSSPDVIVVHNSIEIPLFLRVITYRGVISLIRDNYLPPGSSIPMVSSVAYWLCYCSLRCPDKLYFVSKYCQEVNSRFWRLPTTASAVLYNGVDLQWFRFDESAREEVRRQLGYGRDDIVVGYVGRVCLQKGTDVLVEAFRRAQSSFRDIRLLIVGPCGQFENTKTNELVASIEGVGGHYFGPADEHQIPGMFSAIDIFVMPTIELEMFGMAAVEAKACGCLVLASDHGGLPEALHGTGSVLFRPGDSEDLSRRIVDAARAILSETLKRGSDNPAMVHLARLSWTNLAAQTLVSYREFTS